MKTLSTPRFWDLHLHGVAGIDFMNASFEAMAAACEILGKRGIGFFAPTLLTSEPQLLLEACRRWGDFFEALNKKNLLSPIAATPLGLHLEGPFLNPEMSGAHPESWLRTPDLALLKRLYAAAHGHLAIVTLAPELPGALHLITWLKKHSVRVQLGHTHATAAQAQKAVKAGATGLTHLFNAMKVHHRKPGVLSVLQHQQVTAELITDGVHLDADFALWCWKAAQSRLYAVSDGCSAVGATSKMPLTLGSLKLKKINDYAVVAKSGTLAGGATFLTEHPARLFAAFQATDPPSSQTRRFFELFYKIPAGLFRSKTRKLSSRATNRFDPRNFRFLSTEFS